MNNLDKIIVDRWMWIVTVLMFILRHPPRPGRWGRMLTRFCHLNIIKTIMDRCLRRRCRLRRHRPLRSILFRQLPMQTCCRAQWLCAVANALWRTRRMSWTKTTQTTRSWFSNGRPNIKTPAAFKCPLTQSKFKIIATCRRMSMTAISQYKASMRCLSHLWALNSDLLFFGFLFFI